MLGTGTSATSWPRTGAEHGFPRGRDQVVDTAGGAVPGIVGNERGVADMWIKRQEGTHVVAVHF